MNQLFTTLLFILLSGPVFSQVKCFDNRPEKQNRLIYDQADILQAEEEQQLETKLRNYADTTGSQIAIVAVNRVYCDMAVTAIDLGHEWGVGQEEEDNGVVFLIAKEDRKIFIATGYGVEGFVPDVYVNRIIKNVIRPNFRNYDYYEGLDQATTTIIELLSGTYDAPEQSDEPQEGIPLWVIALIILILFILFSRRGGGGSQYDYGRGGKWILGDTWGRSGGNWGDFRKGKGVFFPPSGGGGSFGGGGGFGGFGGGGFGGGGAGGSW